MTQPADPEKLKNYLGLVFGSLGGAMTSAMICLGDRLGLYRVLAERESVTSAELAAATGLKERWLREWLYAQAASGVLEHRGEERFALSPEGAAVLADENHPAFGAGFFAHLPQTLGVVDKLPEAFRTGLGLPYDAFGPEGAAGIERGFAPWFRTMLVPVALPRLPGVADALRRGATRGRRGLRLGRRGARARQGVPALDLPRLRHLGARARARAREPGEGRRRERALPRRAPRLTSEGREPRLRHRLRLSPRHGAPRAGAGRACARRSAPTACS